jgi:hypothetical protein
MNPLAAHLINICCLSSNAKGDSESSKKQVFGGAECRKMGAKGRTKGRFKAPFGRL